MTPIRRITNVGQASRLSSPHSFLRLAVCLLLLAFSFPAFGQFHAYWYFTDRQQVPATNRNFELYPLQQFTVNGTNSVAGDRIAMRTDVNGYAVASNLVPGTYRGVFSGRTATTTFTNTFTNGTSGYVNGADFGYISTNVEGGTTAYSKSAADARFVDAAGDTMTGGLTNTSRIVSALFIGNADGLTNSTIGFSNALFSPNTNELYVTLAGTNAANGRFALKQAGAFGGTGRIFTNETTGSFCVEAHGGLAAPQDGDQEQHPFYIGVNTNNDMGAWYISDVSIIGPYKNTDEVLNNNVTTGPNPSPTVKWGTNTTYFTNTVVNQSAHLLSLKQNKIILVATNGSDVDALNFTLPFRTCLAAKNYATNGWKIIALDGVFYETNLLKNGVDWEFMGTIGYESAAWEGATPVFSDVAIGAVTSNIRGKVFHYVTDTYFGGNAILVTNPATRLNIEFDEFDGALFNPSINAGSEITTDTSVTFCNVTNCSLVNIKVKVIGNRLAGTTRSRNNYLTSAATYGQLISMQNCGIGFWWDRGDEYITFDIASVTGGGRNLAAFWSKSSSTTDASDFYIRGNKLTGLIYFTGSSPLQKVWVDISEHLNTGQSTYFTYGSEKGYVNSQKIEAIGANCFNFAGIGTPQKMWITAQKLTTSNGMWFAFTDATSKNEVFASVQHFEDRSAGKALVGIDINSANTTFYLTGQRAKNNNVIFNVTAVSNLVVEAITLDTKLGTNACVQTASDNISLQNVRLVSGGSNGVYAASGKSVAMQPVWSNTNNHANITVFGQFTNAGGIVK